ncbi:hypothetical protein DL240_08365 [Lujinxingia litoralis]|uniref:Glycosyltransferase RgtA/B/C/D-like domain-containing protein n=1 Tax=Lujinxingia litoralis TaxID=2211119 RepID=A0A328CBM4_9DELT|nr:glycosyltransferase family 39 protein [Lujinxingia litoralis]RAL22897.1 hypothetical protein DL240_08365 [Lujinxingia litoralis]
MPSPSGPKSAPTSGVDWLIALLIFVGSVLLLLATAQMGFTRDEGFYFHAASQYIGWFEDLWRNLHAGTLAESFTQANVDRHWSYNPEHPVLMKAAFALSHKIFHEELGWMSHSTAWRFPTMVTAGWLLSGVYLFGRQLAGRLAGLVAVGALLLQPRFFFHAHLACFDVAVVAMNFWVVYAYWRSLASRGWAVTTGLLFGLALSTKLNAFFLPITLVLHWLITHPTGFRRVGDWRNGGIRIPRIPAAFWAMLTLGPLLFFALWPRHWFDTFARVRWYMNFHLKHEHYFVYYFGENLQNPPFPVSYPWVMTLVTVPATLLLAAALGCYVWFYHFGGTARMRAWLDALRQRRLPPPGDPRGTAMLFLINFLFPIALIARPETPIFGGTKHWMPAMPFLAIVAGIGVAWLAREAARALPTPGQTKPFIYATLAGLLFLTTLAPAALATRNNHPFGTSYYNELIGGHPGAADRRMFRQFWGYASRDALPWLNEHANPNDRIWIHNTVNTAWNTYQREGLARQDLRATRMNASDKALYFQQKAFNYLQLELWEEYGTMAPSHVVELQGVPLLSVYERSEPEQLKFPQVRR